MAELKRKTLLLSSGKQVKLFGSSVAIAKTLEIGEGYAPNIFSCINNKPEDKTLAVVSNPHQLNFEEMMELEISISVMDGFKGEHSEAWNG